MTSAREELLRELSADRWLAHRHLFPHRHPDASPPAHRELVENIYRPGPRQLIEGFRGFAKSTYLEEAAVLRAAFREFRNMVVVGSSYRRACDRLASIKREIEINELIARLFGPLKGDTWQEGKIVLATGACIQAIGRDQQMLGIKHLDWRPDAALVDDVEDPDEVRTDAEREQTWNWLLKTFLPSLDHPLNSWVRVLGTRRGSGSLPERLEKDGWPTAKFPIEFIDPQGARRATWPAKFPLPQIDAMRQTYRGDMDTWMQEYMCQPVSAADRTFRRETFRVEPRPRSWHAVHAFIDPASSVNRGSATTGWAAWSWIGPRLVVWDAGAARLLPDAIVALAYRLLDELDPVWLGVERDGLNQFLMQPLRQEQIRRGLAALPLKPVSAISGTRGGGKLAFIRGLQPFFEAGEVIFAKELPDLENQLLSFPHGAIDVPNALAYAQLMRPGLPVHDNFGEANIVEGLEALAGKPLFLAGNAEHGIVTAILAQRADGELRVLADWVREGSAAETVGEMHAEAALTAETGRTVERTEYGTADQPFKLPRTVRGYASLPVRWVVPMRHRDGWHAASMGLLPAIRSIPQAASAVMVEPERARAAFGRMLSEQRYGRPKVSVSPQARWTLRALTGGYSRSTGRSGLVMPEADEGVYKVLMEGLEAFAAVGLSVEPAEGADQQPVAYDRRGVAYRSAMPAR